MQTVFSHIIQKRFSQSFEDVATDALAFILANSEAASTGFMKLLAGTGLELPQLRFRTQQTEESIRPDMWGFDGADPRVFVENKFWAGLTDNQPVSYLQELAGYAPPTLLLVVVPAAREQTIWRELTARLDAVDIGMTDRPASAGVIHAAATSAGPVLALTSWPRVLSGLEADAVEDARALADLAQLRALCDAADSDAFVPVSPAELTDQRTPAFIVQTSRVLQAAAQAAAAEGAVYLEGLRPQSSTTRMGRYVGFPPERRVYGWLGVHLELWRRRGCTPAWLMFYMHADCPPLPIRRVIEPWAAAERLPCHVQDDKLCIGLRLRAHEEKDVVVRDLVAQLRAIGTAVKELGPPNDGTGD